MAACHLKTARMLLYVTVCGAYVQELAGKCMATDASERPTFSEILELLKEIPIEAETS